MGVCFSAEVEGVWVRALLPTRGSGGGGPCRSRSCVAGERMGFAVARVCVGDGHGLCPLGVAASWGGTLRSVLHPAIYHPATWDVGPSAGTLQGDQLECESL